MLLGGISVSQMLLANDLNIIPGTNQTDSISHIGMEEAADRSIAPNLIPDQYIVVYKDGAIESAAASLSENSRMDYAAARKAVVQDISINLATRASGEVNSVYSTALNGFGLSSANRLAVEQLLNDDRVAYVQADEWIKQTAIQNNATWGLDRVDQTTLPLDNIYEYTLDGTGVNTYIVDSGINNAHQDFSGRLATGSNHVSGVSGTNDCNGHGSHVAGSAGGSTYGVAKNTTLYPVRVFGCQASGSSQSILGGIDWVAANHTKPAVANMSLGAPNQIVPQMDQAVRGLASAGVVSVLAAGNDTADACNSSPARVGSDNNILNVASSDRNDSRSSFSNFGSCVDLFAPGGSITSAGINTTTGTSVLSGTSMAAPHVAGAAALYLQANPNSTPAQVEAAIKAAATPNQISDLRGTPNLLLNTNFNTDGGGNPPPPPPPPPPSGDVFANTTDYPISNYFPQTVTSPIAVNRAGASGTIRVKANVLHTRRGQIAIYITAPNGASGLLKQANLYDYGANVQLDVQLNAGSIPASGNWRLTVVDNYYGAGGVLDSWSIEFL